MLTSTSANELIEIVTNVLIHKDSSVEFDKRVDILMGNGKRVITDSATTQTGTAYLVSA